MTWPLFRYNYEQDVPSCNTYDCVLFYLFCCNVYGLVLCMYFYLPCMFVLVAMCMHVLACMYACMYMCLYMLLYGRTTLLNIGSEPINNQSIDQ